LIRLDSGEGALNNGLDIIKYLPSEPSYSLYIKSLKKVWNDFETSYFWQKYRLTKNGEEIDRTINSISASFFIIGLNFNDLLEIFSGDSSLSLWISNNYITSYLYLIKSTQTISQFIERLNYYAIANKITYNKYNYNSYEIINFSSKMYIAYSKEFTLISDDRIKIEKTINNIENNNNNIPLQYSDKFSKNKNIILWNNINKSVFYSIEFKNYLDIEALSNLDTSDTNAPFNYKELQFIPPNVNFISFSHNSDKINNLFSPLFTSIDTNLIKIDTEYFETFFNNVSPPGDEVGTFGMKITSKRTNILFVFKPSNNLVYSNYLKIGTDKIIYYKKSIYKLTQNQWKYFSIYNDYILISNSLTFLQSAIENYKKQKSFYYSLKCKKYYHTYLLKGKRSIHSYG